MGRGGSFDSGLGREIFTRDHLCSVHGSFRRHFVGKVRRSSASS